MSEEVKYSPTRSATTFLKPFMLNQFKSNPMLDVCQRSRLFTEEGGKARPEEADQRLAVCGLLRVGGRNRLQSISRDGTHSPPGSTRGLLVEGRCLLGLWVLEVAFFFSEGAFPNVQARVDEKNAMTTANSGNSNSNENELIQTQMAQKQVLRGEVGSRALRVWSVSREEVWASAGVQGAWVGGCGCEAD